MYPEDRHRTGYGDTFPGDEDQEAFQITNFGLYRRLDGLSCDYMGFRYRLIKAKATDEGQRLLIESAEEEISRTPAEVYITDRGLRDDMADKRRSIRRGCYHPDRSKYKWHR
jgi:hypothetical protein